MQSTTALIEVINNGQLIHSRDKKIFHADSTGTALKAGEICADLVAEYLGDDLIEGQTIQLAISIDYILPKKPSAVSKSNTKTRGK